FLDLSGPSEIKGVWKESITLPCAYVPVEDFVQQTLTWTVVHDKGSGSIFQRDGSSDHVLLSEHRDRVSIPMDAPGNVNWRDSNNSLIAKEITTKLEVVKVAATKPIIRAGELGLMVSTGASTSLTCKASGSPPLSYRWFRSTLVGKAVLLRSGAELVWPSLRPSDKNRAGAVLNVGTMRGHQSTTGWGESGVMDHTVTDPVPTTWVSSLDTAPVEPFTDTGYRRVAPSPLLYGLAAALGEPLYEVAFHSTADVALLHTEVEVPDKCLHEETCSNTEKTTVKDRKSPEYENLVTTMESQYETEGI
ncbi:hypothetical protein HGM15179_018614, partial [Zosterops borbonicus]